MQIEILSSILIHHIIHWVIHQVSMIIQKNHLTMMHKFV